MPCEWSGQLKENTLPQQCAIGRSQLGLRRPHEILKSVGLSHLLAQRAETILRKFSEVGPFLCPICPLPTSI